MAGAHALGDRVYLPGSSPLHALPPECKLAAAFAFVIAVVSTPREAFWAFGVLAAIVAVVAAVGRVPASHVLRRLRIEIPFLAFAVLLPIVGHGERVDVLGFSLSVEGLWAGWNIVAKGTLGVAATIVLTATTPVPAILDGLHRLHVPRVFVTITSFMVRYLDVVGDELRRMSIARRSRAQDPRWIWQARAVAATAGALFVRSYERGERVYLAMVSRGYDGSMPVPESRRTTARPWLIAMSAPAAAALVSLLAWVTR
jgi:cobalt/nickel transport system permease protein